MFSVLRSPVDRNLIQSEAYESDSDGVTDFWRRRTATKAAAAPIPIKAMLEGSGTADPPLPEPPLPPDPPLPDPPPDGGVGVVGCQPQPDPHPPQDQPASEGVQHAKTLTMVARRIVRPHVVMMAFLFGRRLKFNEMPTRSVD